MEDEGIDRKTGDLWVGDVGWELWELIDKVEPRGELWAGAVVEGPQPVHVVKVQWAGRRFCPR